MRGFIYICKMEHEGQSYYKIGKARNVSTREASLKVGNPFMSVIAITKVPDYTLAEAYIHSDIQQYHFSGEWYVLTDEQYTSLYKKYGFFEYVREQKEKREQPAKPKKRNRKQIGVYHLFKKDIISKKGQKLPHWYYWYYDESGKQIQKSCLKCETKFEAENYIDNLSYQ